MGMTRREVAARLDEIVEFSECGAYIDTPVRRYSSGMFVRLGFAVAAHLNAAILVVDEVLAVGDVRFQTKCIDKMTELAGQGVTIVFVSHNPSLVQRLCSRAAVIDNGQAVMFESVDEALGHYHRGLRHTSSEVHYEPADRSVPQITRLSIDTEALEHGRMAIDLDFEAPKPFIPVPGLIVYAGDTLPTFTSNTRIHPGSDRSGGPPSACRSGTFRFELENLDLYSGVYSVSAWLGDKGADYDLKKHAFEFTLSTKHQLPPGLPIRSVGPMAVSPRWTLL
jgi:lipopolysaccharide transport system ATP-binding protein